MRVYGATDVKFLQTSPTAAYSSRLTGFRYEYSYCRAPCATPLLPDLHCSRESVEQTWLESAAKMAGCQRWSRSQLSGVCDVRWEQDEARPPVPVSITPARVSIPTTELCGRMSIFFASQMDVLVELLLSPCFPLRYVFVDV